MENEKIVSIEDRIPKLKEARKKKANRRLLFYLTIFFILISTIVYLQSPLSNVKEIAVLGNDFLPADHVVQLSELSLNMNIWNVRLNDVEKNIVEHPLIEKAEVIRKLPQTIEVHLFEHRVIGYVDKEGTLYPVTSQGVVVPMEDLVQYGSAPLLSNFNNEEFLVRIANELKEIPDYLLNLISEVIWQPTEKNNYKIVLYMNDGYIVHSTIRDFSNKIKTYPSIISQLDDKEKGIIHMDVGIYVEPIQSE